MRIIDYDKKDKNTGGTDTHEAVDDVMKRDDGSIGLAYEEGFAASHGVRPETAETGGRMRHPDMQDDSHPDRIPNKIEKENPGLADG